MDKIKQLHWAATLNADAMTTMTEDHATITEDMMGRFAEWVDSEGFQLLGELWENIGGRKVMHHLRINSTI